MSGKKSKLLRRKAEDQLIGWIKTMTPEGEDANRITRKNLQEFLPEQLKGQKIYTPGNNKKENEFRTYLKNLWKDKYDY